MLSRALLQASRCVTPLPYNSVLKNRKRLASPFLRCLPRWHSGKESACHCRRCGFSLWVRKIPWRTEWQSTPVFLPGKFNGQRSLVGYNPWGHKKLDMTEQLSMRAFTHILDISQYSLTSQHTHTHGTLASIH